MIKTQRGVTLIELIISMVLGLALVAGIGQLFIQSQKSFRLQRNLSDMTDDATFLLENLAKGLLLAGYSSDGRTESYLPSPDVVLGSTLKFDTACTTTQCEFIKGTDNSLIYRFKYGDATSLAVNGISTDELQNFVCTSKLTTIKNQAESGKIVSVYIYKQNDTSPVMPVLYCRAALDTPASTPPGQPLISEVEKLQFSYGVRVKTVNASGKRTPENDTFYYTSASNITDWKQVLAVKVFLVMRSVDDNLTKNKATYEVDGVTTTASDHRLYKVFTKTIYLRAGDTS